MKLGVCLAVATAAATLVSAQPFRSGISVVRIDVSVVDKNGALVKGLTKNDFTILEDGQPAPIVAFEAVNIPQPAAPPPGQAAWVTENRRDVISNRVEDRRVVMILMDDATMPFSASMVQAAKKIGHDVVAGLGDADRAAVVFTSNSSHAQDFTTDKSRLNAAIDKMDGGHVLVNPTSASSDWYFYQAATRTLSSAVDMLKAVPQGRKAVVLISTGVPTDPEAAEAKAIGALAGSVSSHEAALRVRDEVRNAMTSASLAQVAVYAFDPGGISDLEQYVTDYYVRYGTALPEAMRAGRNYARASTDFLEGQAETTGGLAIVRTNDYSPGIKKMFDTLSNFYLIGFSTSITKPGSHSLKITTTNPDFTVQSRTSFRVGSLPKNARPDDAAPEKGMGLTKAMTAALPEGNLPMRVAAAPFMGVGNQHPVAIALGIHQPKSSGSTSSNVMLKVNAFSADQGKFIVGKKLDAKFALRATDDQEMQYEMLSSLRLKPGRYQIRLGAEIAENGLSGSVFADVEVPDFAKDPVSMSGLALSMTPSMTQAPKDAFKDISPLFTAHRSFGTENQVSVLARVYQGGKSAPADVKISARVMDVRDRRVYTRNEVLAAGQFASRAADYVMEIPMATLDPGEYLLVVEAALPNGKVARRDLRFTRR